MLARAARVRLLALDVDGVLTDGRLYFDNAGNEMKAFHTGDGLGLKTLQATGVTLALITGRSSDIVTRRAAALGIRHVYQGSDNKLDAWRDLQAATGIADDDCAYAGDDWIDLPILSRVGLAISVPNGDEAVRKRAHWVTPRAGGEGAARDICNLLLAAQGHLDPAIARYLPS
ncbi:HAD hydrolase family protein [Marinihelvus fidelis]|uniref:3-deoxy-D-manno-octulosonate 8-phosphate phosphatase KdsC n=1 Tax=Marinihelvus fidelis TaxID=2613842 RepID=A0A5N0TEV2_9GAMM|nr:HAD hydrolase family protein [Marinihelvus fidelis]